MIDGEREPTSEVVAAAATEPETYETVFRKQYAPLCKYAAGFTRSWDVAEEVVQAVFVALWSLHEQGEVPRNLKAYLYTAVRNRAFTIHRNELVAERVADAYVEGILPIRTPPGFSEFREPPDVAMEQRERYQQLRAAILALPERTREILTLRWEHEMSYNDIGEMLGIHSKSAKQQVSRALVMLRRKLAKTLATDS